MYEISQQDARFVWWNGGGWDDIDTVGGNGPRSMKEMRLPGTFHEQGTVWI